METVFIDRFIVQPPVSLNPLELLAQYRGYNHIKQARFKTSLVVTYHPNVSASTPGEFAMGVVEEPTEEPTKIMAAQSSVIKPVWSKCSLHVPKTLLNFKQWTRAANPARYLCTSNLQGTITITCTLQACVLQSPVALYAPGDQLDIDTRAFVGPRLAGFSLVSYIDDQPMTASTGGWCLTIDLQRSQGYVTNALYVRTPEAKPYVAVRYGWYTFTFYYNSVNNGTSWRQSSDVLKTCDNSDNSGHGRKPGLIASWAPIRGSTSWWCETRPDQYRVDTGGPVTVYRPYSVLFLYYDYGDVDIFSSDFKLSPEILPSIMQPDPGPGFKPGQVANLTLNGFSPFLLSSAKWNPTLTVQEASQKHDLLEWRTRKYNELYTRQAEPFLDETRDGR